MMKLKNKYKKEPKNDQNQFMLTFKTHDRNHKIKT